MIIHSQPEHERYRSKLEDTSFSGDEYSELIDRAPFSWITDSLEYRNDEVHMNPAMPFNRTRFQLCMYDEQAENSSQLRQLYATYIQRRRESYMQFYASLKRDYKMLKDSATRRIRVTRFKKIKVFRKGWIRKRSQDVIFTRFPRSTWLNDGEHDYFSRALLGNDGSRIQIESELVRQLHEMYAIPDVDTHGYLVQTVVVSTRFLPVYERKVREVKVLQVPVGSKYIESYKSKDGSIKDRARFVGPKSPEFARLVGSNFLVSRIWLRKTVEYPVVVGWRVSVRLRTETHIPDALVTRWEKSHRWAKRLDYPAFRYHWARYAASKVAQIKATQDQARKEYERRRASLVSRNLKRFKPLAAQRTNGLLPKILPVAARIFDSALYPFSYKETAYSDTKFQEYGRNILFDGQHHHGIYTYKWIWKATGHSVTAVYPVDLDALPYRCEPTVSVSPSALPLEVSSIQIDELDRRKRDSAITSARLALAAGHAKATDLSFNLTRSLVELKDLKETYQQAREFLAWLRTSPLPGSRYLREAAAAYLGYKFAIEPTISDVATLTSHTIAWILSSHRSLRSCLDAVNDPNSDSITLRRAWRHEDSVHLGDTVYETGPSYNTTLEVELVYPKPLLSLNGTRIRHSGDGLALWSVYEEPLDEVELFRLYLQQARLIWNGQVFRPDHLDGSSHTAIGTSFSRFIDSTLESIQREAMKTLKIKAPISLTQNYRGCLFGRFRLEEIQDRLSQSRSVYLRAIDAIQPISTAWELMPLSFVMDWIVSTREFAQSLSDFVTSSYCPLEPDAQGLWLTEKCSLYARMPILGSESQGVTISVNGQSDWTYACTIADGDSYEVLNLNGRSPNRTTYRFDWTLRQRGYSVIDTGMYRFQRGRIEQEASDWLSLLPRISVSLNSSKSITLLTMLMSSLR